MSTTYVLAVDIGASSGRHILCHLENGKMVLEEIYRFKNGLLQKGGHLCWDIDRLYSELIKGLQVAKRLGKAPSYLGIDTWGVDYVLLDQNDKRLGESFGYRDGRTQGVIAQVHEKIPFDELYQKTGIQFQPFNTIYQLYADRLSGKLAQASSLLMLPDYLNFLLTGKKRQEYTNATTSGLVSIKSHAFDPDILAKLGYSQNLFAPMIAPGTLLGPVSKEVEERLGFPLQVVVPCTHDTASAVAALPSETSVPYISSGTWSLLGLEREQALVDSKSRQENYTNEGAPKGRFRYQKNIMGLWMIQRLKSDTGDLFDFAELSEMAKANPSPYRLDVNDLRFLAPKNMKEEVEKAVGASLSIAQAANVILESMALFYQQALDALEKETGCHSSVLHIIGGGSKNEYLNYLTALRTGKTILAGPSECTAIGNLAYVLLGAEMISESDMKPLIMKSFDIKEVKA